MELSRIASAARFLLIAHIAILAIASAKQNSPPDQSPEEASARLRIWAMLVGEKLPLTIQAKSPGAQTPQVLFQGIVNCPLKGIYIELPKGATEVEMLSGEVAVKTEKIYLAAKDYRTVLVTRRGASLDMTVLQDPTAGQTEFLPTVRLFNYGSERTAEIRFGLAAPVSVPPNAFLIHPLTARGTVRVEINIPDPAGGPPATSITDVRTATSPSWSIVTIPDYRGNLRPRVSPDGPE